MFSSVMEFGTYKREIIVLEVVNLLIWAASARKLLVWKTW